ncbi:MAG TPA: GspE/PulE family protein [Candidatus Saccharimonadia bacterium]
MYPELEAIKSILLKESYISEADNAAAQAVAHDSAGYIEYLIQHDLLSKTLLGHALAEAYQMSYYDLTASPIGKESITAIPETTARSYRMMLAKDTGKIVTIVTDDARGHNAKMARLEQLFPKRKIKLVYGLPESMESALSLYNQPLETRFSQIIESGKRIAPEIVDAIIGDAISYQTSDVHFEPQASEAIVRFRVDGNLRVAGRIPKEYYENILNRLKVEGGMRIDEHFSAQDGAITREVAGRRVDLRVSLVPTVQGEKVALRLLNSYVQDYSLEDIGLSEHHRDLLQLYSAKPFGMILTVGPTGSGKTTTLYSLLKLLNQPNVNITSIEDPVEYKVAGINQIQVHEASGLTFAKGLRAIVRQDPNIILVGEVRDQETAEISVNAALTGHLLLSTFHANDAATAVPRLIDMGIEPFLLASTLQVVIAQRLGRKICHSCRYSLSTKEATRGLKTKAPLEQYLKGITTLYAGKGCTACNGTGYSGRIAFFEFLEVSPEMQDLIVTNPSTSQVEELARKQGCQPMFQDGINKAKDGVTTIAEVVRVVAPPRKGL